VGVGVFGCCPEAQEGCAITFTNFKVSPGIAFAHDADGNTEPAAAQPAARVFIVRHGTTEWCVSTLPIFKSITLDRPLLTPF
jgi:hypothetical protein